MGILIFVGNKKYTAVIYDWDGCLLQSLPVWVESFKRTLNKAGVEASTKDIVNVIGNWDAPIILGHPEPEQANIEFLQHLNELICDISLYPNVVATISAIRNQDIKVFLVTSSKRSTIEATRAYQEVSKMIDFAVFADDVSKHKPDPEGINLIIEKFSLNRDEVLMVGDSDKDIIAAHNAKIDCSWFAPSENENLHDFIYLESLAPKQRFANHLELVDFFSYKPNFPDPLSP